jgi:hypothetical protein
VHLFVLRTATMLRFSPSTVSRLYQEWSTMTITYFAKKCILLLWASNTPPTFKMWIDQIVDFLPLEKLTYDLHKRQPKFDRLWSPLFNYISNWTE